MKIKKILIFISDEGFGHTVRQRSLIKAILKNIKYCEVEVITSKKILLLKETFKNKIKYHYKHNLIETIKKKDGSIDKIKTKKMFHHWFESKKKWVIDMCKKYPNPDLIISDSVPQAFELARKTNTKSINISHFTWNWFYRKHFSQSKNDPILKELDFLYNFADRFFILPITPLEIINKYKGKIHKINFIISDFEKKNKNLKKNKKNNNTHKKPKKDTIRRSLRLKQNREKKHNHKLGQSKLHDEYSIIGDPNVPNKPSPSQLDLQGEVPSYNYRDNAPEGTSF